MIVIVIVIGPEDPPASCVDETKGEGVWTLCVVIWSRRDLPGKEGVTGTISSSRLRL